MKILSVQQIRELDAFTIEHEPIASIDLMERASLAFVKWFGSRYPDRHRKIFICCGPGNNGGDGLAIARLLSQDHYDVTVFQLLIGNSFSEDYQVNLNRLKAARCCQLSGVNKGDAFPVLPDGAVVIDAIFGSGLSRPVEGYWDQFIGHINQSPVIRVSVDIPSGMFADEPTPGTSILAHATLTFELPKIGFLYPENQGRVGDWSVASIGLDAAFIQNASTPFHYLTGKKVGQILHKRQKFDHKGTYGHALVIAGGFGKAGAAVLAARAATRSGAGLVTTHVPACVLPVMQTSVPEAMVMADKDERLISEVSGELAKYQSIGIGCGIGTHETTGKALEMLFNQTSTPMVLDADALNLIAGHPALFKQMPKDSILTPHPREFQRLFGHTQDSFERNALQRQKAREWGVYILLKGAHSALACPDGTCYFNATGNPGMATGGSGDVLTGILTGLMAQGYHPGEAALLGMYLHGLSGDLTAEKLSQEAMVAGDIIDGLPDAFLHLHKMVPDHT